MGVVDLHPPSFAFVAFEEIDGFVFDHDDVLLIIALRFEWELIDSKVISFYEVPDHLGDQMSGLLTLIVFGVVFVDSEGGHLSAQAGIT